VLVVNKRRTGVLIAQTLLGLVLLAAWLYLVDLREIGRTLSQARWHFILLAAAIGLSSGLVRAIRWRFVLSPIALVPWIDLWLISMASSLVNFVIPLRTGEIARSILLKQRHRVSMAASLPTIAVDRSFDLMAVLILGTLGGLSGIQLSGRLSTVLLVGGIVFLVFVVFLAIAILAGDWLLALAARLLNGRLRDSLQERILGILRGFLTGFATVGRRPRMLIPMLALSLLAAVMDSGLYYCLLVSLGAYISPAIVLTGYALFALTFLVPGAPGYVGSMEAFGSLVFGALGVGIELAASSVVLYHALNAVILAAVGGIAMWTLGLRPSNAVRSFIDAGETLPDRSNPEA
jgi:uncharacterized protein (TIRG00374 family)